jgi:hypothetical protein
MGHYSFRQIFQILQLSSPTTVEASRSQFWKINDFSWHKQVNQVSYPRASIIHWEFPARSQRPPVRLTWYDGGLRPPMPDELDADGSDLPEEGLLLIGDEGKILADFRGGNPRLLPKARMTAFQPPPPTLPRPINELDQFVRACHGGPTPEASFEKACPFAETILLGTIALRVPKKLRWDPETGQFTNSIEANRLRSRKNRSGWEI